MQCFGKNYELYDLCQYTGRKKILVASKNKRNFFLMEKNEFKKGWQKLEKFQ